VFETESGPYKPDAKIIHFYQPENSVVVEHSVETPWNTFWGNGYIRPEEQELLIV
jgi:hypothetical protein